MLSWIYIFFSSFFIALSGALMPGPLLLATVAEASQTGFWAGPLLVTGHGILELGMLFVLLLGLSPFFQNQIVMVLISFIGGMVLLWMAIQMFRSIPQLTLSIQATRGFGECFKSVLGALVGDHWIGLYCDCPAIGCGWPFRLFYWAHSC